MPKRENSNKPILGYLSCVCRLRIHKSIKSWMLILGDVSNSIAYSKQELLRSIEGNKIISRNRGMLMTDLQKVA